MSWLDRFFKRRAREKRIPEPVTPRALAGGRVSVDTDRTWISGPRIVLPPEDYESDWRMLDLDDATLDQISPASLIEYMGQLSPDISRALWDFLRFCNPGFEIKAYTPGSQNMVVNERAQAIMQQFLDRLKDLYGSVDIPIGRLFIGAFLRGAFACELVLDRDGRTPIDLATPDPQTFRFEGVEDAVRGLIWIPGQWQGGKWVQLDVPTVRYVPVDPYPGSPYGRSLVSPALFSSLFLLGLLHDLRRVVAQQGYPRLDIAIDLEKMVTAMPASLISEPTAFQEWVDATIAEVKTVFSSLQPDDTYIHTDVVTVNRPVGAIDSSSLSAVDGLFNALDRRIVQALKTMPLLMGLNEANSETHANRQWEVHVAGIKSLQHSAETMLERVLGLALQAQGIAAIVDVKFAELRGAELLRDAQVKQITTENATNWYNQGWVSQDEAAQSVVGHVADVPEPRSVTLEREMMDKQLAAKGDAEQQDGQEPVSKKPNSESGKGGGAE